MSRDTCMHSSERPRSSLICAKMEMWDWRIGRVIRPANAKRSDVKRALTVAAEHFEELAELWEEMHGE